MRIGQGAIVVRPRARECFEREQGGPGRGTKGFSPGCHHLPVFAHLFTCSLDPRGVEMHNALAARDRI